MTAIPHRPVPTGPAVADHDQPLAGAIIAGLVGALVGGGLWAGIVLVTNYEVGWVAWGVGALVGIAMSRATRSRGRHVALTGALLAALGLVTGKLLIISFGARSGIAQEIVRDQSLMAQAALFDLTETAALPETIQAQYDALGPADTVSDSLWVAMQAAGASHAEAASSVDRERMADAYAVAMMSAIGTGGMLRAQLGAYDLLWFFLALTTAWRMLSGRQRTSHQ